MSRIAGRKGAASPLAAVTDANREPVLAVRGLAAGYGAVPVISDIDLEVRSGELVALLGPNGAGKSTTLAAIAGDIRPLRGEILWRGREPKAAAHQRAREGLAFVTEGRSIIHALSVMDNLRLGTGTVEAALSISPELKPLLRRRAGLLSGGEQQMLALSRALAGQPDVLMVDELSTGLAPIIVDRLMNTLLEAASRGTGVLLVEQHIRKALSIADRVYVLRLGELALSADASEFRHRHDVIEHLYMSGQLD